MQVVNIYDAKTQLSKLVDQAANGKPFVIAKNGKPLVKVTALNMPAGNEVKRTGFLKGHVVVPEDFDKMGSIEIEHLFGGKK